MRAVTLIRSALRILEAPSVHVPNLRFAHSPFKHAVLHTHCDERVIAETVISPHLSAPPAHGRFDITTFDYISNFEGNSQLSSIHQRTTTDDLAIALRHLLISLIDVRLRWLRAKLFAPLRSVKEG